MPLHCDCTSVRLPCVFTLLKIQASIHVHVHELYSAEYRCMVRVCAPCVGQRRVYITKMTRTRANFTLIFALRCMLCCRGTSESVSLRLAPECSALPSKTPTCSQKSLYRVSRATTCGRMRCGPARRSSRRLSLQASRSFLSAAGPAADVMNDGLEWGLSGYGPETCRLFSGRDVSEKKKNLSFTLALLSCKPSAQVQRGVR